MLHILRCIQICQHQIVGRILLEFKGNIEYFTSNNIVAADDYSQSSNEALMVKI